MVIDPGNSINTNSSTGTAKGRQGNAAAPSGKQDKVDANTANAQSPDKVFLSSAGQNLAKLEAQLAQSPDVDEAKVAEARAALANGSYKVDPELIADRMLQQDDML